MQITVNETGARTIADSRPMRIDGQNVYVVVDGGTASLIVGGLIVATDDADDMTTTEAQTWAVNYRNEFNATVEEAVNTESVYAGAVAQIRDAGQQLLAEADKLAQHGEGGYRRRNTTGRMVTLHNEDPRHPMRAAETLRKRAAVFLAWTATDEQGYGQYVSDGIGGTDGYYAPVARDSWKAFLSA